jgi:ribonuclease D
MTNELVTDVDALATTVARLCSVERYALDTEFHRERTS